MKRLLTIALLMAGPAALSGAQAAMADLRVPLSLTSFGAAQAISSYQMSAAGLAMGPGRTFSPSDFAAAPQLMPVAYGGVVPRASFAASTALSINLALDSGYNLDLARRFDNYDALKSPLIAQDFLGLANGGTYVGVTYVPLPALQMRVGAQLRNDRLDSFSFDPTGGVTGVPFTTDGGETRSLLAGASWNFASWAGLGVTAITSSQQGLPAGFGALSGLNQESRVSTSALSATARMNFGGGWVTTATVSGGLSQLDQKAGPVASLDSRAYSIAIAKHGVFGEDALGFSLSSPSPSLLDNGFEMVAAAGDLPPAFVAGGRLTDRATETDLQLGYVTSFLDGALALQTNASYQMNYQGQTGATSVAVLSRAKIKF